MNGILFAMEVKKEPFHVYITLRLFVLIKSQLPSPASSIYLFAPSKRLRII